MKGYALTDKGRKREVNQDYIYASTENPGRFNNLFILADGMGGHKAGGFASRFLVERIVNMVSKSETNEIRALRGAIELSNTLLFDKSRRDSEYEGMGSTVVAAIVNGSDITIANVGDSRLYIISDGINQITKDHSLVEEMVRDGELVRGSEEYRAKKRYITRAVGAEESVQVDFFEETLNEGDYVLMCSDGLSNMITDDEMLEIITGNGSIRYKAKELVDRANRNGGSDNIAVILLRYGKDGDVNA
ncbi:MAG: Stp1/IreP family PP2C-type Ser/Thr phosphatase [Eubacteriales bacterium]|nr:Stp1/IreP family PP2C-type Ser/Thr phosphatase [Eubacteriales bacterium]